MKKVVPASKKKEDKDIFASKAVTESKSKKDKKIKVSMTTAEGEKKWSLDEDITEELLDKRVNEIVSSRGRKNTDPRDILRKLEVLAKASRNFGPKKEIPVLMHVISVMYDKNKVIDDYMEIQEWRTCYRCVVRIVGLLHKYPEYTLGIMADEDVTDLLLGSQINNDFSKKTAADGEDVSGAAPTSSSKNVIKVVGTLEHIILRLEDEYTKSLQQINQHTQVSIHALPLTRYQHHEGSIFRLQSSIERRCYL